MIWPLHFLRPWWWLALLALPPILYALARGGGGRAALARLADAELLPHLVSGGAGRRRCALILAAAVWLLAVAALAGPAWQRAPVPLYANGAARVIALSLSDDMLAQDLKPDRLTRARYAVRDLLDAAGDARTALIAYAGDAFVVAPLTPDRQTVLNLLEALDPSVMPEPGNDAARAIGQALALLRQAHANGGEIVLVTDDAGGEAALAAARRAHAAGVRVDVLGIGTAQGAPVPLPAGGFERSADGGVRIAVRDDASLRDLAAAGGGTYAPLRGDGNGIAAIGAPSAAPATGAERESANLWRDAGAWLLLPLLPLVALAFRRGWLCMLALVFITPFAHASVWNELWTTPDQRAQQALRKGDYAEAARVARDPLLRGAAAYRDDDYAAAAGHFAQRDDVTAQYDFGNALAKSGHYRQAIAAYERALKGDPGLADARANRAAVLAWLNRHPQQMPPQNGQGAQGKRADSSQQRNSRASSQPQQPSSGQGRAKGASNPPREQRAGVGGNGSNDDARQADNAAGRSTSEGRGAGDSGASTAEDARQRAQARRAQQALHRELARQPTGDAANAGGRSSRAHGAFALGADQARRDGKFDPQQRALLNAVPDDPGALLRRKFMLEWQRRHGQQPDDDQ